MVGGGLLYEVTRPVYRSGGWGGADVDGGMWVSGRRWGGGVRGKGVLGTKKLAGET